MVAMVTVEQHLGIVAMTTQPNFVPDLPTVNNNGNAVMPRPNQQQSEPQNLSSSQTSESQTATTSSQSNSLSPREIAAQEAPLSLAKVLVPAQVAVVAHSFSEQQSQQQSVLFQALTAQSAPHFIALTVPSQDNERHEITVPGAQGVSCVQYIDEGGGTNVFSAPNSQIGNSKYHYYGIRLKPSSSINKAMEDIVNTTYRHNSFMHMRRLKAEHSANVQNNNNCNGKRFFEADEPDKKRPAPAQPKSHHVYLGDASTAIPDVEIELDATPLPSGITLEKITLFRDAYRKHCENILEAVVNFQFSEVESLWHVFWNTSTENRSKSDSDLIKPFLLEIVNFHPVKEFIKRTDYQFYQNLVDVLIPDVLRPIPSTLTQAIRNFAKSLEGWLRAAIAECGDDILNIKISAISAFAQTLRRYTSLNHLAQAARAVLQSSTQIKQMTTDLNKVDFRNIQEQASWVCQCEDGIIRQILTEFRQTLQHNLWLEDWASWLENIVHKTLEPHEGKPTYPKAARQFLLKWSFYSSLVIRDLTLRSAASFGSFHLLRLLYDEFMFFVIEHCIAKATGTTSIAVMGEYLCSGKPEQLSDMLEPSNTSAVSSDVSENETSECIVKEESSQDCEIPVPQE
ncbi:Transcription factor RFX3 [Araneus ventricosus]|uniref:Transcription factor RFX3 n=1 Tax=Araneus ventricosus TaxID=182803 RepID=A0A4Y2JDU3_ARAVE|nr:Transcription factor RFX3 [Araneus ventricosus]